MMNMMRGAGRCLEAVDGHGHTVDESHLLEAAKVERVVQVEDLECVRPVLDVDGDEVRDLQRLRQRRTISEQGIYSQNKKVYDRLPEVQIR